MSWGAWSSPCPCHPRCSPPARRRWPSRRGAPSVAGIPGISFSWTSMRDGSVADDARRDEDQQFGARHDLGRALEQVAEVGNVAQERDLVDGVALVLLEQATKDDCAAVLDQRGGLDVLGVDRVTGAGG